MRSTLVLVLLLLCTSLQVFASIEKVSEEKAGSLRKLSEDDNDNHLESEQDPPKDHHSPAKSKPPPSDSTSGSSASLTGSGGSSGGSGGGGGGSSGGSGGSGGGGGGGGGEGGGGGGNHATPVHAPAAHVSATGILGLVAAVVVLGAGIASVTLRGRKVAVAHPLKGAINRRIEMFTHLAAENKVARPPRRYEEGDYHQAPDGPVGTLGAMI